MTLNSVVFPAPFGPIRPTIWPWSTVRETSSIATMPPKRRVTLSTASSATAVTLMALQPFYSHEWNDESRVDLGRRRNSRPSAVGGGPAEPASDRRLLGRLRDRGGRRPRAGRLAAPGSRRQPAGDVPDRVRAGADRRRVGSARDAAERELVPRPRRAVVEQHRGPGRRPRSRHVARSARPRHRLHVRRLPGTARHAAAEGRGAVGVRPGDVRHADERGASGGRRRRYAGPGADGANDDVSVTGAR